MRPFTSSLPPAQNVNQSPTLHPGRRRSAHRIRREALSRPALCRPFASVGPRDEGRPARRQRGQWLLALATDYSYAALYHGQFMAPDQISLAGEKKKQMTAKRSAVQAVGAVGEGVKGGLG